MGGVHPPVGQRSPPPRGPPLWCSTAAVPRCAGRGGIGRRPGAGLTAVGAAYDTGSARGRRCVLAWLPSLALATDGCCGCAPPGTFPGGWRAAGLAGTTTCGLHQHSSRLRSAPRAWSRHDPCAAISAFVTASGIGAGPHNTFRTSPLSHRAFACPPFCVPRVAGVALPACARPILRGSRCARGGAGGRRRCTAATPGTRRCSTTCRALCQSSFPSLWCADGGVKRAAPRRLERQFVPFPL